MRSARVTIVNRLGLHARAAARFVGMAATFRSDVRIRHGQRTVNGKSIMGIMMLAAACGSEIEIVTDGPDEEAALAALVDLVADGFGE